MIYESFADAVAKHNKNVDNTIDDADTFTHMVTEAIKIGLISDVTTSQLASNPDLSATTLSERVCITTEAFETVINWYNTTAPWRKALDEYDQF